MNQKQRTIAALRAGEVTKYRGHGNSMHPIIPSGSLVTLEPVELADLEVGDCVFCKVRGNVFVHKVSALKGGVDNRQVQISNNRGHVNGWTYQDEHSNTMYHRPAEIRAWLDGHPEVTSYVIYDDKPLPFTTDLALERYAELEPVRPIWERDLLRSRIHPGDPEMAVRFIRVSGYTHLVTEDIERGAAILGRPLGK